MLVEYVYVGFEYLCKIAKCLDSAPGISIELCHVKLVSLLSVLLVIKNIISKNGLFNIRSDMCLFIYRKIVKINLNDPVLTKNKILYSGVSAIG